MLDQPVSVAPTVHRKGNGFGRWTIIGLLALGVLIAYLDRTSISSALADSSFNAHFGLSDIDRGWINSAFFWTFAISQLPMGWLVDRYGVKYPYAVCFAVWCLATLFMGLVSTLVALVAMRLIIGAAEGVLMPASFRWVRQNFGDAHHGTASGILAAGNKFGPALGAPAAAWLIVEYDWRTMFVLTGGLGLVWLVPWLLGVSNDWPKGEQLAQNKKAAASVSYRAIMASPLVWGALIVNFAYGYFTFFCMTWMPSYLVEQHGLSLEQSGIYTFFSFAGIAIVAVLAGWFADRLIARGGDPVRTRKVFIVAGFLGACTVLLGTQTDSLNLALFWNVFSLSALGLATANNLALCRLTLIPPPAVGRVTAVQQVASAVSGGVAAGLSGWLLHVSGSYTLPMFVIFVILLIGAAATIFLLRAEWAPQVTNVES